MSASPHADAAGPLPARPAVWRIWLQAVRIFSFTASVIPIVVGSMFALIDRSFDSLLFALMLVASVSCHAGANLANDYFDHQKGVDSPESLGPSKVIQRNLLSPAQVKRGMAAAFGVATVVGAAVVALAGWTILWLALASLAAAFFYTGGPRPLGYVALGEVTVFIFMGPVMVGGAYFAMTDAVTWQVVVASLGVAALVAAILHANNIRDIEPDRAAGKTTLATLLGRRGSNIEYAALVAAAFLSVAVLVGFSHRFWPTLAVVASLPVAWSLVRLTVAAEESRSLNVVLRKTAGLHLRFGALLTLGLFARAILDRR